MLDRRVEIEKQDYKEVLFEDKKGKASTILPSLKLIEATQKLDHLSQRLSDPHLYSNQQETCKTVQTHKQVKEQVREMTHLWKFLPLELEEMKGSNPSHQSKESRAHKERKGNWVQYYPRTWSVE